MPLPRYDVLPFDDRFDLLVVEGQEVGFLFREAWDLSDGTEKLVLLLGNTTSGHTVSAETLDALVLAILEKTAQVTQGQRVAQAR